MAGLLAARFDRTFLSFQTRLLKPDPEAFAQVAEAYDCRPAEILFFDDNPLNVDAAARFGMQAFSTKGPAEAMRIVQSAVLDRVGDNNGYRVP